jgi:hypothetical protein
MKKINIINIIGEGYNCNINFNHVVSCFHDTDKRSVCIQYNTIVDDYPFKVNYFNVIEVNYLGEKL